MKRCARPSKPSIKSAIWRRFWLDKGVENARDKAVIARLKNADADGLDHTDYKTPTFDGLSPEGLAEAELTFTQTLLDVRAALAGRTCCSIAMVREDNIALPQRAPDPARVLAAVADAADAGHALEQFSPPYENYQKLKAALAFFAAKRPAVVATRSQPAGC